MRPIVLSIALLSLLWCRLEAQGIRGLVVDSLQKAPVVGAVLTLTDGSGVEVGRTVTADDGFFSLGVAPGTYRLQVLKVGLTPIQFPDIVIGPDAVRTVQLVVPWPTAELEPIEVEAEPVVRRRGLSEFDERRETSTGSFITREEFERSGNAQQVTHVLQRMQGVSVHSNPGYGNQDFRRWIVSMKRGVSRTFGGAAECAPLYFRDRQYLGSGVTIDIDVALPLMEVEAVEAYSGGAGLPQEFNRPGAACGVIVFWTR